MIVHFLLVSGCLTHSCNLFKSWSDQVMGSFFRNPLLSIVHFTFSFLCMVLKRHKNEKGHNMANSAKTGRRWEKRMDTSTVRLAVPVSSVFVISVPFFRCLTYYVVIPKSLANNYVAKKKNTTRAPHFSAIDFCPDWHIDIKAYSNRNSIAHFVTFRNSTMLVVWLGEKLYWTAQC